MRKERLSMIHLDMMDTLLEQYKKTSTMKKWKSLGKTLKRSRKNNLINIHYLLLISHNNKWTNSTLI